MARLRSHLLRWLLIPLVILWIIGFRISVERSLAQANEAYDRTLLGSALAMAERISMRDGALTVDMPYAALEMLETSAQDRIFYKVTCLDPLFVVTGHEDLPPPDPPPTAEQPVFYDSLRDGEGLRMVALTRPLYDVSLKGPILVQVGETLAARQALSRRILIDSAVTQLALIAAAALLITFGVRRGLRPLARIRGEIKAREETDLTPIDTRAVPREVVPLIDAINLHTHRQRELNEAHRQFIADASHQLKTPLTVLKTQSALALQQDDPQLTRAIVREIHDSTDTTSRVIQQLLALARSEPGLVFANESFDLVALAHDATFDLLPQALAQSIDLGFDDVAGGPLEVRGQALLLREVVSNLVDNAIRYTPPGGHITVRVQSAADGAAVLEVEDNGPGIPAAERAKVFDRFYRLPGSRSDGCGLGLAIVRQIVERHGARIELLDGEGGRGLRVRVAFPVIG